jgi:hypothetical protein
MRKSKVMNYIILAAEIAAVYIMFRAAGFQENKGLIQGIMAVLLIEDAGVIVYKKYKGSLEKADIVKAILFAGLVMRIGYMLYNGFMVRSHDLGDISVEGYGHAAYILKLIKRGHLPDTNYVQLYQQPLFYILGSGVSKLVNGILRCMELYYLVDAAKLVSCFASCATLLVANDFIEVSGVKDKGHLIALSLVAFLPDFYLVGGRVNCDALAGFFMALAVLYTFYWYKDRSWKNTICLAVIYGLGMMTKISCATVALFTAGVFVKALYDGIKEKHWGPLILKYMAFGAISLPLGLWYSFRNYQLFGQKLTYVVRISEELPIYTGNRSIFQRMFYIDIPNLFSTPYGDPWKDYSLPVYLIKSALFGEFKYTASDWLPVILLFSTVILTCFVIAALVWQLRKNRRDLFGSFNAAIMLIMYVSTLFFYKQYPFGCSMDFRYLVFLTIPMGVVLGKYYEGGLGKTGQKAAECIMAIYAAMSCIMYVTIK